jgi:hypothetical protein
MPVDDRFRVEGSTDLIFPERVTPTGDRDLDVGRIDLFTAWETATVEMVTGVTPPLVAIDLLSKIEA